MNRISKFEKVSLEQYIADYKNIFPNADTEGIRKIYDEIKLPVRATAGSAGYDFFAPYDIEVSAGNEVKIPTGIRASMNREYVLMLFPRSSLGFKYRFQLDNTVGIIDSDYYNAKNEGHIFAKLINDSREGKSVVLKQGDGMLQGIFLPFGITEDDCVETVRTGGFGSTNRKEG